MAKSPLFFLLLQVHLCPKCLRARGRESPKARTKTKPHPVEKLTIFDVPNAHIFKKEKLNHFRALRTECDQWGLLIKGY